MHKSKLFTLLKGLQHEEIHWFQKFLRSPFYNNNELYIKLFDYIRKYLPALDSSKLDKTIAFKKLFPGEKLQIQKLRKTMHGLTTLLEEYLVAARIRNSTFEKKKLLVAELGARNVYTLFEKGTGELVQELEALPYRNTRFYKEVHDLNLAYYSHFQTNKQKGNTLILESALEHLDYYFLMQKQRLELTIKWHEKLIGDKFRIKNLEQSRAALQKEPVFELYELIIKALADPENESIYLSMESLFKEEIDRLEKNDQIEIIGILLNHLNSQVNKGKEGYQTKMLTLYKFGLNQNLLIENGQINETIFINIATTGIAEREYDWVERFVEAYKPMLPANIREDATCLSLGLLFFYKKEYLKTIQLILNRQFLKPLYILKSKSILLRTYFEQFLLDNSYYELLFAQSYAFEKFVRRSDLISNNKKDIYLNFIFFLRKIANTYYQKTTDPDLYSKIKNTDSLVLKSWLLEKSAPVSKK